MTELKTLVDKIRLHSFHFPNKIVLNLITNVALTTLDCNCRYQLFGGLLKWKERRKLTFHPSLLYLLFKSKPRSYCDWLHMLILNLDCKYNINY